jgi:tRNA(Ile)-lysidine synthase
VSRRSEGRGRDLPGRVRAHVRRAGLLSDGDHVLVALSGGLDSVVLLHLFRFFPPAVDLTITAAHLDHRMRAGSSADAEWVRGLSMAWEIPLVVGSAEPAPTGEAAARTVRYAFLRRVAGEVGATSIATAHHADDQAETVLFRAVRGTGPAGLAGIRDRGPGGLVRPLLPFWRRELEEHASEAGLRWRFDPTNEDRGYARNVLRREILPRLEAEVAPAAREALVRLARLARREDTAWQSLLPGLLADVVKSTGKGRIVVARRALLTYHPAVRARLVRALARRLGVVLDEAGTREAMRFAATGPSGKGIDLASGLELRRDFEQIVLEVREGSSSGGREGGEDVLVIPASGSGSGTLDLDGWRWNVYWRPGLEEEGGSSASFSLDSVAFPLQVRRWHPGDRIRLDYGEKKLKKLFAEARIPARDRRVRPVLVDARDEVLWVPGLARSARIASDAPGASLTLGVEHVHED